MNQRWTELTERVLRFSRDFRKVVIRILDEAVEDEFLTQDTADQILLEWDVLRFPEQVPAPLREHVQQLGPMALLREPGVQPDEGGPAVLELVVPQ